MVNNDNTDTTSWPWWIAGGLASVVVANAIMISIALRNPSAASTEDHWQQAKVHDQVMQQRAAADALGWSVAIEATGPGTAVLRVLDHDGLALHGARVTARAERADDTRYDRVLTSAELEPGRYALTGFAISGLHRIEIEITGAGTHWVGERTLMVVGRQGQGQGDRA